MAMFRSTLSMVAISAGTLLSFPDPSMASSNDGLLAAAKKEGRLVVMALPRDWCNYGRIIDGFKAKYGLDVEELKPEAPSAKELDAIRGARDSIDAEAPDVIDVGLSFASSAKAEGLLQPYKVSVWEQIPGSAKDPEGYWYGDYYGVLAFEVNADLVSRPPTDWADLLSPEFKGSVGLAGELGSNHAVNSVLAAGLSASNGNVDAAAERGLAFFAELARKGNFVPRVANTNTVVDGRTPIVIRWDYLALSDRDALRGKTRIEVAWPRTGLVAGTYVQAISAFAEHPNAARLWMEHLYSDEGQLLMLAGRCYPIRYDTLVRDGKVPASLQQNLPRLDDQGRRIKPVFPTAKQQERAREIIINGWDDIVGVPIECSPPEEPIIGPTSSKGTATQLASSPQQCPAAVAQ